MRGRSADASVPGYLRVRAREYSRHRSVYEETGGIAHETVSLAYSSRLAFAHACGKTSCFAVIRSTPVFMGAAGVPNFTGVKWQFHTQGQILSSPAIAGDKLYLAAAIILSMLLISPPGRSSGNSSPQAASPRSPAVSAGVVYFGSLMATSMPWTRDRQLKWKFQTGASAASPQKHLHGAEPAADTMPDRSIFTSPPGRLERRSLFGSGDTNVYALEAASAP